MAAISQQVPPDEVLPLLARNVVVNGYQEMREKASHPTEYLILLRRYLQQARELQALAGAEGVIRVSSCEQSKPLLDVLGYRLREACTPNTSLETADADRAFLTIDSGFPLEDLELALRSGKPFVDPYPSTPVPVLFSPDDWMATDKREKKQQKDLVDFLVHQPGAARLYWALSRIDEDTRSELRQSPGLRKLLPDAAVLDFYGSHICIRAGRVEVPGGPAAAPAWKSLVGADPAAPSKFIPRLVSKDEGWLAAYFDALSRISRAQQAYFTEPRRLQRFYQALRGEDVSPSPARPSFRPDPGLFLLVTRLQLDSAGQPEVPGNLSVWKQILNRKSDSKIVREWASRAHGWKTPQDLIEAMFGLSRVLAQDGPLQMYLMLSEIDRDRAPENRLSPSAVLLLTDRFSRFSDQYLIFSEFRGLDNASITRFMNVAEAVDRIPEPVLRTNAIGTFQAAVSLWQILARQGQIPQASLNVSWQHVVNPFARIRSSAQLFDAGRSSLGALLQATIGKSTASQDEIIALLAGPNQVTPEGRQVRQELANRIRAVLEDQRLVSLDTLFVLGNGLSEMERGNKTIGPSLVPFAEDLRQFEMPRPLFTNRERSEWTAGLYDNRHTVTQMHTDLTKVIEAPGTPKELSAARGQLAPFFRDTLVGLNYAYYEPPGAQMLHNNPLFVRSHDFSGQMTLGGEQSWQTPTLFGRGWTASGGAHLAGSLANLPYVLAVVEQDFIVPRNIQSLIWEDLVPGLLTSAVLPRWWRVTKTELHAVTLYQRTGEELLAASMTNETLRQTVMNILADCMLPQRSDEVEQALRSGHMDKVLTLVMPSETFYLAAQFRRKFPGRTGDWGAAGNELEALSRSDPGDVSWQRISEDFGVPHPALADTYGLELLNMKPVPTFMGYSSRLLAESWDSNNLYWARLADEMGYQPVMLNRLIPQLTEHMVSNIFATHPDDWPAVFRAMRQTGEEFRQGKIASIPKSGVAGGGFQASRN